MATNDAAIPVIPGLKSKSETFPGADASYSIEAMMGDGRALQSGTSHNLGQNFSKVFDIQYQDENSDLQHCWTTSWGVSTRMVGAIIMTHGDDQGLVLPPRLAPIQVVIVPIWKKNRDDERRVVMEAVDRITSALANTIRIKVDDRDEYSPGWKFNEWELKGVPLRIEIGPREVQEAQAVLCRRDKPGRDGKSFVPLMGISEAIEDSLAAIQNSLLQRATTFRTNRTSEPTDYNSFRASVADGFARAWWCGKPTCENKIKTETQASARCIPLEQPTKTGKCVVCHESAKEITIFARAY